MGARVKAKRVACDHCHRRFQRDATRFHFAGGRPYYGRSLRAMCKGCRRAAMRRRYRKQREHLIEQSKAWKARNPEKVYLWTLAYRALNRERLRMYQWAYGWWRRHRSKVRLWAYYRRYGRLKGPPRLAWP